MSSIILKWNRTTGGLDPFSTKSLMSHLSSSLSSILSAIISSLINKQSLDSEILKNYMPIAHLSFIKKKIENTIATQIHSHLINNDLVDKFQCAYKVGHSCETALLRVYNDRVTTIDRCYGAMLIVHNLSAAFDTIDHENLFCIPEKYVGIYGNALKIIKSYFLNNRSQRVQIDNVLFDFAIIICGVPQDSVSEPLKFSFNCL